MYICPDQQIDLWMGSIVITDFTVFISLRELNSFEKQEKSVLHKCVVIGILEVEIKQ